MAKKKSKKIEKETRQLIESISDVVKKKGDRYKFKTSKKKTVRRMKRSCPHWIIRKGKEDPALRASTMTTGERDDTGNPIIIPAWECIICGAKFPISPVDEKDYRAAVETILSHVNQIQFWSVKMGGNSQDTRLFLKLKELLPQFHKVQRQIVKQVNKREKYEANKSKTDMHSQFDGFTNFTYQ